MKITYRVRPELVRIDVGRSATRMWIIRFFFACWFAMVNPFIASAHAADPIVIGVSLGLNGKFKSISEMQERGFRLWESQINKSGGLLGRQVKVLIHDDQSNPVKAAELYEKLITEDKVDFLFGPYSSGLTLAVMPVVEQHDVPLLASGATADKIWQQGYRNVLGLYATASRYPLGFLELVALKGFREIAIVAADDSFSLSVAEGAAKWAREFGMEVSVREEFVKGTRDLTNIAQTIAEAGVDVVLVCGHFNESVDMRKALAVVNYTPSAYFATVGPALEKYREELGDSLAEHTFTTVQWSHDIAYKPQDRALFNDPFVAAYGMTPPYQAAIAYTAGVVLSKAIERADSVDRNKVRNMLYSMDIQTITGRYGVDRTGMQIKHVPLLMQWQEGEQRVVWPEYLAVSAPILDAKP